jgi:hypothetical protein
MIGKPTDREGLHVAELLCLPNLSESHLVTNMAHLHVWRRHLPNIKVITISNQHLDFHLSTFSMSYYVYLGKRGVPRCVSDVRKGQDDPWNFSMLIQSVVTIYIQILNFRCELQMDLCKWRHGCDLCPHLSCGSTTVVGSDNPPILHVPAGWYIVITLCFK